MWNSLSAEKLARPNKKPACRSKRAFVINQRNFIVRVKPELPVSTTAVAAATAMEAATTATVVATTTAAAITVRYATTAVAAASVATTNATPAYPRPA